MVFAGAVLILALGFLAKGSAKVQKGDETLASPGLSVLTKNSQCQGEILVYFRVM